jgi:ParB-like chromosome segregation protein Spo0J
MKTITVKISEVKSNPNNPRIIKDDKFQKLVASIKELPQMLQLRPIVVNEDMVVLGGNMRLKACKEAGLKEIPIIKATDLSEEQQRAFIIKDNVGFGEWDWDALANEWDAELLTEWGLDVWKAPAEVDYSILDEADDLDDLISDMANGVKKAIQIEFEAEHYEEAYELVKFWRERKAYVGGMIMEYLKEEKEKL